MLLPSQSDILRQAHINSECSTSWWQTPKADSHTYRLSSRHQATRLLEIDFIWTFTRISILVTVHFSTNKRLFCTLQYTCRSL